MVTVSSWGKLSNDAHEVRHLSNNNSLASQLRDTHCAIAHGMGRSYGDVCLNPGGVLWKTNQLDRFISFNEETGRLVCEAGVLLGDIQRMMMPRGWCLPVTPGTQFVTVGGAIANDVHGKNHHVAGSFGNHVQKIELIRTDGTLMECGPTLLPDWFSATVGGLGLTGVIAWADIQLKKVSGPWLDTQTLPFTQLDDFFQLASTSEGSWEHTVAWIDCLSKSNCRGIFMRANPSAIKNPPYKHRNLSVPFQLPFSLINRATLKGFNELYFHLKKRKTEQLPMHYQPFFYPLDNISHWNKMYGPKGFYQYQCVLPETQGHEALQAMLNDIARSGEGSFLAVLKTFGDRESLGMLSFPKKGATIALDFPNRGEKTLQLLNRLDDVIRDVGGRIYPAKDARMPRDLFEAGYPRLAEFQTYRDPGISSSLSRRLMGF